MVGILPVVVVLDVAVVDVVVGGGVLRRRLLGGHVGGSCMLVGWLFVWICFFKQDIQYRG